MSQQFEGRSLEEALENAARTLGAERYQIQYSVLEEKRGFLGGVKRVLIDAVVNDQASIPDTPPAPARVVFQESPVVVDSVEERAPLRERSRPEEPAREKRPARRARKRTTGGEQTRGESDRSRRPQHDDEDLIATPKQGAESEGAAVARAWCERVISLAGLLVDVRSFESEQAITLRFFGRDVSRFTEEHGELLDAVQVLANKALVGRSVPLPIELDCGEFKERREEELALRARKLADRVRRDGREELLPAMSPIERRIVHIALREDVDVTTESRGEGFFKRVAIIRRPEESASAGS